MPRYVTRLGRRRHVRLPGQGPGVPRVEERLGVVEALFSGLPLPRGITWAERVLRERDSPLWRCWQAPGAPSMLATPP